MSKSRSLTPTNTFSPSRKSTQTRQRRSAGSPGREVVLPIRPRDPPSQLALSEPGPSKRKRSPSGSDPESPSTKRARIPRPIESQIMRASPSTSSNEGSDDLDMRVHRSPTPQPPSAPEKKKRTRTLTTPHQAAVLNALWAQSQFPTTAMREEVGRSIGLSARKVQIWFQNQRQKMRRPKSQSEAQEDTAQRQPRHGKTLDPVAPLLNRRRTSPRPRSAADTLPRVFPGESDTGYPGNPTSNSFPGPFETIPQLQGPGVPGPPPSVLPGFREASPPLPAVGQGGLPYSNSEASGMPGPIFAHSVSGPQPAIIMRRDPSRTLPPLGFGRPTSSQRSSLSSSASISSNLISPRVSTPPEHDQPRISPTSTLILPPPFALEPQPQWDTAVYSPRPTTSFGGSDSSAPGAFSPEGHRSDPGEENNERDRLRTGGRYDPVRDDYLQASKSEEHQRHLSSSP